MKTGGKHVLVKSGSQSHPNPPASASAQQQQQQQPSSSSSTSSNGNNTKTTNPSNAAAAQHIETPPHNSSDTVPIGTDLCLTWTEYGPDRYLDDRETLSVLKALVAAQHPYVARIEYATANDSGALCVRRFGAGGTVKDRLCGAQPRQTFLQKYGNPKGRQALPLPEVALWTRQILEALRWLHERGMPSGHVHAGNVLVVDGRARLLDVENWLLGVPAFYRPFFMQHSKIGSAEAVDVYSFGHLVFEMAMGYALQESTMGATGGGMAASLSEYCGWNSYKKMLTFCSFRRVAARGDFVA